MKPLSPDNLTPGSAHTFAQLKRKRVTCSQCEELMMAVASANGVAEIRGQLLVQNNQQATRVIRELREELARTKRELAEAGE